MYAPFGDDPVLLHDVTIRNTHRAGAVGELVRVLGREPVGARQGPPARPRRAELDARRRILSVGQAAEGPDRRPLRIFAAALRGPVAGHATDATRFFGAGGRAAPAAVAADRLDGPPAAAVAPARLGARCSRCARRCAWRPAPRSRSATRTAPRSRARSGARARWRAARRPLARSQRRWARWLPQASLGARRGWLARELQWAAYTVRSGTTYEECARSHVISQGGYYQYGGFGDQIAFRDPLQHMLPMIYAAPALARDVLVYSARQQPAGGGQIPYGTQSLCRPAELPPSNDMDLWLLWSAAEYGLATRDLAVFDRPVPFRGGGPARSGATSSWPTPTRSRCAARTGATARPPPATGPTSPARSWRWTESTLVSAQLAYVYPRLAELAERAATAPSRRGCAAAGRRSGRYSAASGPGAGTPAATGASAGSAPA